jgi:ABC-type multidrug transport system fused ATPase/permease subunit
VRYLHLIPLATLFVVMVLLGWPSALAFLVIYGAGFVITSKVQERAIKHDRKRRKNLPR